MTSKYALQAENRQTRTPGTAETTTSTIGLPLYCAGARATPAQELLSGPEASGRPEVPSQRGGLPSRQQSQPERGQPHESSPPRTWMGLVSLRECVLESLLWFLERYRLGLTQSGSCIFPVPQPARGRGILRVLSQLAERERSESYRGELGVPPLPVNSETSRMGVRAISLARARASHALGIVSGHRAGGRVSLPHPPLP